MAGCAQHIHFFCSFKTIFSLSHFCSSFTWLYCGSVFGMFPGNFVVKLNRPDCPSLKCWNLRRIRKYLNESNCAFIWVVATFSTSCVIRVEVECLNLKVSWAWLLCSRWLRGHSHFYWSIWYRVLLPIPVWNSALCRSHYCRTSNVSSDNQRLRTCLLHHENVDMVFFRSFLGSLCSWKAFHHLAANRSWRALLFSSI